MQRLNVCEVKKLKKKIFSVKKIFRKKIFRKKKFFYKIFRVAAKK